MTLNNDGSRESSLGNLHYHYQKYSVSVDSYPNIAGNIRATVVLEGTVTYYYSTRPPQTNGWSEIVDSSSPIEYIAEQQDTKTGDRVTRTIERKKMSAQPFYIDGTLYEIASDNTITYNGKKYKVMLNL